MARRMKRSRGLGSPVEEHKDKAASLTESAKQFFSWAIDDAKSRRCRTAASTIRAGVYDYGRAEAHRHGAGMDAPKKTTAVAKKMSAAANAFDKHCLVAAGLSGMKRRSRR